MTLDYLFATRPARTTATFAIIYLVLVFALIFLMSSCSVLRREGSTSPCYAKRHYSGYGGQFKASRMGKR